jgi:hypothetical protein
MSLSSPTDRLLKPIVIVADQGNLVPASHRDGVGDFHRGVPPLKGTAGCRGESSSLSVRTPSGNVVAAYAAPEGSPLFRPSIHGPPYSQRLGSCRVMAIADARTCPCGRDWSPSEQSFRIRGATADSAPRFVRRSGCLDEISWINDDHPGASGCTRGHEHEETDSDPSTHGVLP